MTDHIVIPDTQVRPGLNLGHIYAARNLIMERRPEVIVFLGDWWDFPSLSSHTEKSKINFERRSYLEDLQAGINAMEIIVESLERHYAKQKRNKKRPYQPRLVFTKGNHEYRRDRLEEQQPILKGAFPTCEDYLWDKGFEVYPYKQAVVIDGVTYCHLCPQSKSSGAVERAHLIAQKRSSSWTVGHSQQLDYYVSLHKPRIQCIIAGAYYQHDEGYKDGSNDHWRGLVYKHNVTNGTYDSEFFSVDRMIEEYL